MHSRLAALPLAGIRHMLDRAAWRLIGKKPQLEPVQSRPHIGDSCVDTGAILPRKGCGKRALQPPVALQ